MYEIEQDANNAYFIINDIVNISSMDVKKLNVYENKFLLNKIEKIVQWKELVKTAAALAINPRNSQGPAAV